MVLSLPTACEADTPLTPKVGLDSRFTELSAAFLCGRHGSRSRGQVRRRGRARGVRKRRAGGHASITGQFCCRDTTDIAVRIRTVGESVIVGGRVGFRGREVIAVSQCTGEERLFLVRGSDGGGLDVDDRVVVVAVHWRGW